MEFAAIQTKSARRGLPFKDGCLMCEGTFCLYSCGFQPPNSDYQTGGLSESEAINSDSPTIEVTDLQIKPKLEKINTQN